MVKLSELRQKIQVQEQRTSLPLPPSMYDTITAYVFDVLKPTPLPPARVGAYVKEYGTLTELVLGPNVPSDVKSQIDEIVSLGRIAEIRAYILKGTLRVDAIESVRAVNDSELEELDLPWKIYRVRDFYLEDTETGERIFLPFSLSTVNSAKISALKEVEIAAIAITNTDSRGRKRVRYIYFIELPGNAEQQGNEQQREKHESEGAEEEIDLTPEKLAEIEASIR